MGTQHPKPLPGFLRILRRDRPAAHLQCQGRSQFRAHPGRDQQGLLSVGLQKTHGRGRACFVHQQGGVEVEAPQ